MENSHSKGKNIIEANKIALSSTKKNLEDLTENFKLARVLVNEITGTDREVFEKQLEELLSKYAGLEEEFSGKAFEKEILYEEIVNYNRTIEGYMNKLRDKEQSVLAMKDLNKEDNEMNINYEREIEEFRKKIVEKKSENKEFYNIVELKKQELTDLTGKIKDYEKSEGEMIEKINMLNEKVRQKELDFQKQDVLIVQLNENIKNRSVSPIRHLRGGYSPSRSEIKSPIRDYLPSRREELKSPIRENFERRPEPQSPIPNSNFVSSYAREEIMEAPQAVERNHSSPLVYIILALVVVIFALLAKKFMLLELLH